jgi:hypothetical protein
MVGWAAKFTKGLVYKTVACVARKLRAIMLLNTNAHHTLIIRTNTNQHTATTPAKARLFSSLFFLITLPSPPSREE